jgi:hypothetical protein
MAINPAPAAAEARQQAYRLRLSPSRIYACRFCREAVRVTSSRYLPEACPVCSASTWEEDGRCANWIDCNAQRRPGLRGSAHCHACGFSIWAPVGARGRAERRLADR